MTIADWITITANILTVILIIVISRLNRSTYRSMQQQIDFLHQRMDNMQMKYGTINIRPEQFRKIERK